MDSIGLPDGELYLLDYQPAWPRLFEEEAERIRAACGDRLVGIEHIGSTSIPGLAAKPILDIMPLLVSFEEGFDIVPNMEGLGYEYKGEYGIPRRHYFVKGTPRTHHVHMYEADDDEVVRHLLFRDYLREYADTAAEYESLKRRLAAEVPREDYPEAKTGFVAQVLARAGYEAPR
jgi:GrpB-like predicted nucleotidyltransferase (UPF0157 family)